MKKAVKIILIVAAGMVVLGSILGIIGFTTGARLYLYIDKTGAHIGDKIESVTINEDLSQFSDIAVDLRYHDVQLVPSDKYAIEIVYTEEDNKPLYKNEGGTLKINSNQDRNKKWVFFNLDFRVAGRAANNVTVYYPAGAEFNDVKLTLGNGDCSLEGVKAKQLTINDGYGDVDLSGITADTLTLKAENGKMQFSDIKAVTTDIENSYGRVDISSLATENMTIAAGNGDIMLDKITAATADIKNEYGRVDISALTGSSLKLDAKNGNMTVADSVLADISLKNEYGDADITGTKAGTAELKLLNGKLSMTGCDFANIDIKNQYGRITAVDCSFNGLKIKAENGDTDLAGTFAGITEVNASYGKIEITASGAKDFGYIIDTEYGTAKVNGEKIKDNAYVEKETGSQNKFVLNAKNGDIDLYIE